MRGQRPKGWRKVAAATWDLPDDPQIYGDLEVDATGMLAFIEEVRRTTDVRVTVTHVVGKALANALAEHRDLNTRLYRGRFHPRESVDIFFVASVGDGQDVSGVKVVATDRKSLVEIAEELRARVEALLRRAPIRAPAGRAPFGRPSL